LPNASISTNGGGVSIQSDKGSITVDQQGNVSLQSPKGRISSSASGEVNISKTPARKTSQDVGSTAAAPIPPSAPPVPAGPSPEEIAKVEDEADKLNIRGATVSQSIDTLRQQQQASGYGLRGDIASSQERMKTYLAKGNSALQAKDLAGAKKYFDLAESEISRLEKFLGH
jgi:hypothetical protein